MWEEDWNFYIKLVSMDLNIEDPFEKIDEFWCNDK